MCPTMKKWRKSSVEVQTKISSLRTRSWGSGRRGRSTSPVPRGERSAPCWSSARSRPWTLRSWAERRDHSPSTWWRRTPPACQPSPSRCWTSCCWCSSRISRGFWSLRWGSGPPATASAGCRLSSAAAPCPWCTSRTGTLEMERACSVV